MNVTGTASPMFEVFFDGECPLCKREIDFLRRRDRQGKVQFTDIAVPEFDAERYGLTHDDFMAQIRGRLSDGSMVSGVEVFRRLYEAVGFGWLVRVSRAPGISWFLEHAYRWFAKNRLRLTGRCDTGRCEITRGGAAAES